MKKILLFLIMAVLASSCTVRYSKSVSGPIDGQPGNLVSKMSQGADIFFFVIKEPTPANELLASLKEENNCRELVNTEVDYRVKVWWLLVHGHPQVWVSGYCIK